MILCLRLCGEGGNEERENEDDRSSCYRHSGCDEARTGLRVDHELRVYLWYADS
jgi:hypothetical protein